MDVDLAGFAAPRKWREDQGQDDAGHPLEQHQSGKQLVGLTKDLLPVLLEKLFRASARRFLHCPACS
jgi:hypothetical protein